MSSRRQSYDENGHIYSRYPTNAPLSEFPAAPAQPGAQFTRKYLVVWQPLTQEKKQYGMLYVKSDLRAVTFRIRSYASIALLVLIGSFFVALAISASLANRVTSPIVSLADSARSVSERGDYSIRAPKTSDDELGLLTDAFNLMLSRIQEQTLALQGSEQRLRLALEASRTGSWEWDTRTDRMNWDNLLHKLFGLEPGIFKGTYEHFQELIHPEDRDFVNRSIQQSLEQKQDIAIDFRVIWPDQSVHHLISRGKAFYSEDNKPLQVTGVTVDITERRLAEGTRAFLAAIVDSSDDAVIGKDLNSNVVSWNAGAERMFGYTAVEMRGQPITRLISHDRPDEELRVLEDVGRGRTRHFESVRIRKDGQRIEVSLAVSPIKNERGEIIGISSIARDITERKRAEEALSRNAAMLREQAQMLDLANVLPRDMEDRIILWNTGMEKLYGWSREEALGKITHELFRTVLPMPLEEIRERLLREGQWEGELVHFRKDGAKLIIQSQWVLHYDQQGQPLAILEINNDVTQRKHAEEEVLRINASLERSVEERTAELMAANRDMEAFTYSVAHDLRAPLRHIDAFSRILYEDFATVLPDEAKHYLQNIRNGSRHMTQLVDDLLNLARVGRQELRRQPTPLTGLVKEVLAELDRESQGRTIDWRIQPLPVVPANAGLLRQVFVNLLSNAVKYTRPRKVAVIEVGARQVNGETAVFVRDNGVGFSMKYADKLFGVFQRLHRSEEFEGTGVGFATVDRIIRKHGGTIWAEAVVDQGATFYFTIPGLDGNTTHEQSWARRCACCMPAECLARALRSSNLAPAIPLQVKTRQAPGRHQSDRHTQ